MAVEEDPLISLPIHLSDLTPELRRTMVVLDDRYGGPAKILLPMHERGLRVLARFGLADEDERRLTERGQKLIDEGEAI